MSKISNILIADDDAAIVAALDILFETEGYQITTAQSVEQVSFLTKQRDFDLVLLDMNFQRDTTSGQEGLELISEIREHNPEVAIIAMTGWGTVELSVTAMQQGANDFVEKPWDNDRLLSIINNQLALKQSKAKARRLGQENRQLKASLQVKSSFIAEDIASKELLQTATQIACSDIGVLILGDNGTGKSLLAEQIHLLSARKEQPFIAVNMGAIPENLFESELFGHVKGAFTDAHDDRVGRFQLAQGGTLFLDEIANIPLSQQAKLLRVLESGEFEAVGSSETLQADVRIIGATNANLSELVAQGKFRQDLLYRLTAMELKLTALKSRPMDILPLALQQVSQLGRKYNKAELGFTTDAQQLLLDYDWPGNVRELNHCIERAVVLASTSQITVDDLRLNASAKEATSYLEDDLTMDEIEQRVIQARLEKYNGQANIAAESLGLSRSAFYRRLEKFKTQ